MRAGATTISVAKLALLSCLVVGISGCGDDQSTISLPPPAQALTEYQFSATVDYIGGTPPFPVATGDTVTGSFTFDPTTKDTYVLPTQGGYVQKAPAAVQVKAGPVTMHADLNNSLRYVIRIMNDDTSVTPPSDSFSWYVNDTALAASYGLDHIQAGFSLTDSTGTVFNSDAMPENIVLSNYSNGALFLSGQKANSILWWFRAQIESVVKKQ